MQDKYLGKMFNKNDYFNEYVYNCILTVYNWTIENTLMTKEITPEIETTMTTITTFPTHDFQSITIETQVQS